MATSSPSAEAGASVLIGRNPATGEPLGTVERTPPDALESIVARARAAQKGWGQTSWAERQALLQRWWRELAAEAGSLSQAIEAEIGKPRSEAMAGDVIAGLDAIRWTVRHGGRTLSERRLGSSWQRLLLIPPAQLRWRSIGVIGMFGTWNYPLLLNAPPIAQALAAGNAVVWKPSELAPLVGQRLQQSLDRTGLPEGLVTAVFGGPELGASLAQSDIDKGMYTGGIHGGRNVLTALARRGRPALAEFSGYDAAIVLPDAPIETTIPVLSWGAFVGCGQTCVAIKRVYVVGDASPWAEGLAALASGLRVGNPAAGSVDVGPLISESARAGFDAQIRATISAGAQVLAGGSPSVGPGWFYPPTVLLANSGTADEVLAGAFGPVVLVRGVATVEAAVAAANASPFGLAASVWGRDLAVARAVANRLDAGIVAVNDAVAPSLHASAPFGGVKASGYGRTKGDLGLREFVQPQTLQVRRLGGFRPQLFPYGRRVDRLLAIYRRIFHPHA